MDMMVDAHRNLTLKRMGEFGLEVQARLVIWSLDLNDIKSIHEILEDSPKELCRHFNNNRHCWVDVKFEVELLQAWHARH